MKDKLYYKDPDDKGQGHKVGKSEEELVGNLAISKGGRLQKLPPTPSFDCNRIFTIVEIKLNLLFFLVCHP